MGLSYFLVFYSLATLFLFSTHLLQLSYALIEQQANEVFRFHPLDFVLSSMARSNKTTASTMLRLWAHRPQCRKRCHLRTFDGRNPGSLKVKREVNVPLQQRDSICGVMEVELVRRPESQGRATGWMVGGNKWWLIFTLYSFMHQRRSRGRTIVPVWHKERKHDTRGIVNIMGLVNEDGYYSCFTVDSQPYKNGPRSSGPGPPPFIHFSHVCISSVSASRVISIANATVCSI